GSHLAIGVMTVLSCSGMLQAKEFESANPDLSLRWDNTLRYNLGMRAEVQERALTNNVTYDESDSAFDRGDVVTNRVDFMSEFELAWKQYHGFRVSAGAWYDQAYAGKDLNTADGNVYYSSWQVLAHQAPIA